MKIIVAKNIGFCTGVRRAIDIAQKSLEKDPKPVYFLGEIIHNERLTKEIEQKGGKIISDPRKARAGTLVIRAHGTPPLPQLKNIFLEDATCPLVTKAQKAAKTLRKEGYEVIIIGEKNHPEVQGIVGNIEGRATVIKDGEEAKKLKLFEKLGVVAQTTQNLNTVNRILDILKNKTKKLKWTNTLCPQVSFRQKELSEIIKKADGVLVIGSPASANTRNLVEIARAVKKPAWLANSAEELNRADFGGISTLGVVSGTSTPDLLVQEIIDKLKFFR